MKRAPINKISKHKQKQLAVYKKLVITLQFYCNNKSEIDGDSPDWQSHYLVEPHHINGRTGDKLTDPFNIIMVTRNQHKRQEGEIKDEPPIPDDKLIAIVKELRIKQGFKKEA